MARAGEDPIDLTPGPAVAPKPNARRRLHPILPPLPVPSIANIEPAASRRRAAAEQHPTFAETTPGNGDEAKPKRRRGTRGGRKHKKATSEAEAAPQEAAAEARPQTRRRTTTRKAAAETVPSTVAARLPLTSSRPRTPLTPAPPGKVPAPFAHPAAHEFAPILDSYGIEWRYEPRSFLLRYDYGHVVEAFTPDFYLPDLNMYVEVTTLKTGLTAEKNRKMRMLKELYPEVNI